MNKMIYDMMIDDWLIEKGYLCQIVINLRKLNIISENHYLAFKKYVIIQEQGTSKTDISNTIVLFPVFCFSERNNNNFQMH